MVAWNRSARRPSAEGRLPDRLDEHDLAALELEAVGLVTRQLDAQRLAVVSGNIQGKTETATLRVQNEYENFNLAGAYGISLVLAAIAICVLVLMTALRPRQGTG